ncbi:MAG: hypothetical protein ACRDPT_02140 [Streptomycetales bacterium]
MHRNRHGAREEASWTPTTRLAAYLETGRECFGVTLEIALPDEVRDLLDRAHRLRERAEAEQAEAARLSRKAARRLAAQGLSMRDVARCSG